jgi:hypothetical protein
MTYTIKGKQYTEFDINKRCAEILAWESEPKVKSVKYEAGCFWVHSIGYTAFKIENYCTDPLATDAIIDKCWDELMQDVGFDGEDDPDYDHKFGARWKYIVEEHNCTKLVAACICLIELNE